MENRDDIIREIDEQNKRILEVLEIVAKAEADMADEFSKDECQKAMERIHSRIDTISNSAIEIKTNVVHMRDIVDKLYNIIYGNGKDGLATKISRNADAHKVNFLIIRILITAILGSALAAILFLVKR